MDSTEHRYDLVVLGAGAAGEKGAVQAAYFGKRVAIVDRALDLGGATAGTTVPSKTLRETAVTLSGLEARRLHGVDVSLTSTLSVQDFLRHERRVKAAERARVAANLERHGVDRYHGTGRFLDAHRIEVRGDGPPVVLHADVVLIATGSRPRRPEEYPRAPHIYDSDTILAMEAIPRSLAVIGGGVIGCEYACTFAALGVDVHLVHGDSSLLGFMDPDISVGLAAAMQHSCIALHMPARVEAIEARPDGVRVILKDRDPLVFDALMLATGRCANTEGLDLEDAGVERGRRGIITVDAHYRTSAPNIYAAGDVVGPPSLASTGMEQARFAMIQALELPNYKATVAPVLPVGIYTIPECSSAGLRELDCMAQGIPCVVGVARYDQNVRGLIIGDREGFLKLVFHRHTMKLLGVHVLGEVASEVVHVGLLALTMGAHAQVFIDTCFNYPTLGELYKYATYDAMGKVRSDASA